MGDDRVEHEAEYFRRVESRLVALEFKVDNNHRRLGKLEPVVADLRDRELLAEAIADRVRDRGRTMVSRATIAIGLAALFVPPFLTALLVKLLT